MCFQIPATRPKLVLINKKIKKQKSCPLLDFGVRADDIVNITEKED